MMGGCKVMPAIQNLRRA